MKFLHLFLLLLVTFGGLWFGGLIWFKSQIAEIPGGPPTHTDAIVVLTGGSVRLEEGIRILLEDNVSDRLFVSGVGAEMSVKELVRSVYKDELGKVAGRIVLGHDAKNTKENAMEVGAWIKQEGLKSLRLVTSNYHMARSLLEFQKVMPEIVIVPHAVVPEHVKLDGWWQYPGTSKLLVDEYNKYLGASMQLAWRKREAQ